MTYECKNTYNFEIASYESEGDIQEIEIPQTEHSQLIGKIIKPSNI